MRRFGWLLGLLMALAPMLVRADFGDPEGPRVVRLDSSRQLPLVEDGVVKCEIVVEAKASPTAKFAAGELRRFLSESFGAEVPLVAAPTGGKTALVVGTGVDISRVPEDGFIIRAVGGRIHIAGKDHPSYMPLDTKRMAWAEYFARATLFGVYDFLERFLGAAFVFPGEAGTVIPRHRTLRVPAMDIVERPDNMRRYISWGQGVWPEPEKTLRELHRLNNYRLRMQSRYIPNCHGLGRMAYIERFGKEHPEYFALRPNGTRSNSLAERMGGQLCFSSGIVEEIYQDAKAWLTGQSAKSRGMWHNRFKSYVWDNNAVQPGFFNAMPQDGMTACQCEACRKLAAQGNPQWASDQVWQMTCDIANRLTKEGIQGYVTQMAYGGHKFIPPIEIPENVLVMAAVHGPWSRYTRGGWKAEMDFLDSWIAKRHGRKVWLWTYVNKYGARNILDVPCSTPRAVGRFFRLAQPRIFGAYMETETDYASFQFFNWYVMSKVLWDSSLDPDKVLDDALRKLYGAGSPKAAEFLDRLEELWLKRVVAKTVDTPTGPVSVPPTAVELWNDIYGEAELKRLGAILDAAARAVGRDAAARKRLAFLRREYLGALEKGRMAFLATQMGVETLKVAVPEVAEGAVTLDGRLEEAAWKQAKALWLRRLKDEPTLFATSVRVLRDGKNLYVAYDCDEPEFAKTFTADLKHDDSDIWRSDCVELMLNPSGKRDGYYQLIISRKALVDIAWRVEASGRRTSDKGWESDAQVKWSPRDGGWTMEIALPLARLGEIDPRNFVANFCRTRVLQDGKMMLHSWSPFITLYNDVKGFGALSFEALPERNLVFAGDFDTEQHGNYFGLEKKSRGLPGIPWWQQALGWWGDKPNAALYRLDTEHFLVGGRSLRMDNPGGKNLMIGHYLPQLLAGRKYRLSFAVKVEMKDPGKGGVFVHFNDGTNHAYPRPAIQTSCPWTRYSFVVTPAKGLAEKVVCYIRLQNHLCKATVWFDDVRVEEIKE